MLATVMTACARARPMVRTNRPIRSFCSAKTCSTRARTVDFAALARRMASGIGFPIGFFDAARLAELVQELLIGLRAVGAVGPHVARRVVAVDQALAQPRPVGRRRIRDLVPADDPMFAV